MNQLPPYQSIYNAPSGEMQEEIQRGFITRVYGWMTLGLAMTALSAFALLAIPGLLEALFSNSFLFFGILIGELALVVVLSAAVNRMNSTVAGMLFVAYAMLNGVTIAMLMLMYTASSVAITFGITACTFGIMTLFGYTTRRDLTRFGSLLIMGLIGILIASLANMFLKNSAIYWVTTYIGVLIFIGLIAYDTQRLKRMALGLGEDGQVVQKASILGALALYLDFINLFIRLLRILGKRR